MQGRSSIAGIIFAICLYGQPQNRERLDAAYSHLSKNEFDAARRDFAEVLQAEPGLVAARLDYAYLLLRMGETEQGRDEIGKVLATRPGDEKLSIEFAFLAFETGRRAEAFEIFLRLKLAKDEAIRKQATETWERLDRDLRDSIARWTEAVASDPANYSSHEELARLLEERNDWVPAALEYRLAFGLKPDKRKFLLDIARVEVEALRVDYASAALIAASRGADAFVSEAAREKLPARYPYVYEFQYAIQLDPLNVPLRRELGFLLLAMKREAEAVKVFEEIVRLSPDDTLSNAQLAFLRISKNDIRGARPLLERVARQGESGLSAVRDLAEKSLEKGFLKDAVRYLEQLHESSPADYQTMLRLGWTLNMLHQDRDAVRWFALARSSPDRKISSEAEQAYRNLRPSLAPLRVTSWVLPFYSSRWHEVFGYGQAKMEFRLPFTSWRPYISSRMIGDIGPTGRSAPKALSESAVVMAGGLASPRWNGLMAWGEAGNSWQYFAERNGTARFKPDYRGGLNFVKGMGATGMSGEGGWFGATNVDAVFISRFDNNTLFYGQNRIGYHVKDSPLQLYWNVNLTTDVKRVDWANYFETGPGLRWRPPGLPKSLYLFADFLKGYQLLSGDGSRPRKFNDLRIGVWYAFTY